MKIEQIYTGCLAQGAYYVTSNKEAFIIDPLREVTPYLERIKNDGVHLKYIFETHFHADFVSGHLDLSQETGATIVYGPTARPGYEALIAEDGQLFKVGAVTLKVLHTPGHTMESTTFLLIDENGKETALFTGDTLFLGDVGRPDLAQKAADMTQEQLAGMLYDSLMNKIMPLADDITVYPAHGAGSACGKNMMKETVDSLGNQKKMNYALNQPNKEAFIEAVTDGLLAPPPYFGFNVSMNKMGYDNFEKVKKRAMNPLSSAEFEELANATNALILDTRNSDSFKDGFIPQSINIGIKGDFAPWVGALIGDVKQEILLVTDAGLEEEVITRLSRVGFDNTIGYLAGGIEAWKNENREIDAVERLTAHEFEIVYANEPVVFDVRKKSEFESEHVVNVTNIPLNELNLHLNEFPTDKPFILHCAGGYRSMIAASILKSRGIHNFKDVIGGMSDILKTNIPTTEYVCPSTLL